MTRDEALKKVKGYLTDYLPKDDYDEVEEIVNALKQESSNDCISRQALYESLYEHFHDNDSLNNITEVTLGSVRNFVKNFSCVTPMRELYKEDQKDEDDNREVKD